MELTHVDSLCNEFEQRWQDGDVPALMEFLSRLDQDTVLLGVEHLLGIDRHYRQKHQLPHDAEFYEQQLTSLDESVRDTLRDAVSDKLLDAPTLMDPLSGETMKSRAPTSSAAGENQTIGEFRILNVIAEGGMGVVYRAHDAKLDRVVALKMIRAGEDANREAIRRFHEESRAVAGLEHPGIVPVHSFGTIDDMPYFAMGYIDGASVAEKLREGVFAPLEAARIGKQVADAIEYSHASGVVHRDIKPGNILLADDRSPRLTDFGLAKRIEADAAHTIDGSVLGTPAFMPPEQARGELAQIGPRSDVYSIGATLYCMLTGRPPFQADKVPTLLHLVCEQEPVAIGLLNPAVPVDLRCVIHKCLDKDPRQRYQNAGDLAADLQAVVDGRPTVARPLTRIQRSIKWCRRKPGLAAVYAGTLSLAIAFVGSLIGGVMITAKKNRDLTVAFANETAATESAKAHLMTAQDAVNDAFLEVVGSNELLANAPGADQLRRNLMERAVDYANQLQTDDEGFVLANARTHYLLASMEHAVGTGGYDPIGESLDKCIGLLDQVPEHERGVETDVLRAKCLNLRAEAFGSEFEAGVAMCREAIERTTPYRDGDLSDPLVHEAVTELARAHGNLGSLMVRLDDAGAANELRDSVRIYADLQNQNPTFAAALDHSNFANRLGIWHNRRGELDNARKYYTEAMEAVEAYTKDPVYQNHPRLNSLYLGGMGNRAGLTSAMSDSKQVMEFCKRNRLRNPLNFRAWKDEFNAHDLMIMTCMNHEQPDEAIRWCESELRLFDAATEVLPERQSSLRNVYGVCNYNLGSLLMEKDPVRAQALTEQSLATRDEMLASAPKEARVHSFRLGSIVQLAKCQVANQDASLESTLALIHDAVMQIHRLEVPVSPKELRDAYQAAVESMTSAGIDRKPMIADWVSDMKSLGDSATDTDYYRDLVAIE